MQACDFKFTARIGDIEKTVDNFSLAKAPSPQRKKLVTILFHATKDTFHLCVLCAFARKQLVNLQPGWFSVSTKIVNDYQIKS